MTNRTLESGLIPAVRLKSATPKILQLSIFYLVCDLVVFRQVSSSPRLAYSISNRISPFCHHSIWIRNSEIMWLKVGLFLFALTLCQSKEAGSLREKRCKLLQRFDMKILMKPFQCFHCSTL